MVPPCVKDSAEVFAAVCGAGRALGYVCAPSLMQHMLAQCADVRPDITSYAKNRDTLYDALSGMGFDCVKPDGAFYLFIKEPKGDSAGEFCEKAKKFEILLVPVGQLPQLQAMRALPTACPKKRLRIRCRRSKSLPKNTACKPEIK